MPNAGKSESHYQCHTDPAFGGLKYIPVGVKLTGTDPIETFFNRIVEICSSHQPFIRSDAATRCMFFADNFCRRAKTARVAHFNQCIDHWLFPFFTTSPLTAHYALDAAFLMDCLLYGTLVRSSRVIDCVEIEGLLNDIPDSYFRHNAAFKREFALSTRDLLFFGKVPPGFQVSLQHLRTAREYIPEGGTFAFMVQGCFLSQKTGSPGYSYGRIEPEIDSRPALGDEFQIPGTLYRIPQGALQEPDEGAIGYQVRVPGWWFTHELTDERIGPNPLIVAAPGWALAPTSPGVRADSGL